MDNIETFVRLKFLPVCPTEEYLSKLPEEVTGNEDSLQYALLLTKLQISMVSEEHRQLIADSLIKTLVDYYRKYPDRL